MSVVRRFAADGLLMGLPLDLEFRTKGQRGSSRHLEAALDTALLFLHEGTT